MKKYIKFVFWLFIITYIMSMTYFIKNNNLENISTILFCVASTTVLYILNIKGNLLVDDGIFFTLCGFILMSSLLGSCFEFYDKINHYDDFLHLWSGIICGFVGFGVIKFFNKPIQISAMNKMFIVFIIFFFTMGIASLWEIVEYAFDKFLGLNMQAGGLDDTIIDMIDAFIGVVLSIPFIMKKVNFIRAKNE